MSTVHVFQYIACDSHRIFLIFEQHYHCGWSKWLAKWFKKSFYQYLYNELNFFAFVSKQKKINSRVQGNLEVHACMIA
jgi:hypothetical protein